MTSRWPNPARSGALVSVTAACLFMAMAGLAPASKPFLGGELPRGTYARVGAVPRPCPEPPRPARRLGRTSWCGSGAGYAGVARYWRGQYVYQDYLFDALGAASDATAARGEVLDAMAQGDPDAYRLDALAQYALGAHYGAAALRPAADLLELRVASILRKRRRHLAVLARTTTFTASQQPALVLLFDTEPSETTRTVPFESGLETTRAELAALVTPAGARLVDLRTGRSTRLAAAADASGYRNALEVQLPRAALLGPDGRLRVAAATGEADPETGGLEDLGSGPRVANVAFRPDEPVRSAFDKQQAAALLARTIDPFFTTVDPAKLDAGAGERLQPRAGYHVRVLREPEDISREQGKDGVYQDYGLYLPTADDGSPARSTLFLHGSHFGPHDHPALTPGIFRELGEERDSVVIGPRGRTVLSWYVSAGLVDVLQAVDDAADVVATDPRRTSVAGYSMGGFGAALLSELFPDRFAAMFETAGPTGGPNRQTGGPPLTPDLLPTAENLRWVPTVIFHGVPDQQVQYTDGLRMAGRLGDLGLRYRLYTSPGEHYAPGVLDQWAEGASYLDRHRLDPNPPRVTYVRSMRLEREVEQGTFGDQQIFPPGGLRFSFDRAYWMSGLEPRDPVDGLARVDARSLAIPDPSRRAVPEAGAGASPDQTQPWVMTGQAWHHDPVGSPPEPVNGLSATLTGVAAVRLDLKRMRIDTSRRIKAQLSTDGPVELVLIGGWRGSAGRAGRSPRVALNGSRLPARLEGGRLALRIPEGTSTLRIRPPAR